MFQRLDPVGRVLETRYVTVGTPVPAYPTAPRPAPLPDLDDPDLDDPDVPDLDPVPTPPHVQPKLIATGIALVAVGGGAYGAAFHTRSRYDLAVAVGDERAIRTNWALTNGLGAAEVGLGLVGTAFVMVGAF